MASSKGKGPVIELSDSEDEKDEKSSSSQISEDEFDFHNIPYEKMVSRIREFSAIYTPDKGQIDIESANFDHLDDDVAQLDAFNNKLFTEQQGLEDDIENAHNDLCTLAAAKAIAQVSKTMVEMRMDSDGDEDDEGENASPSEVSGSEKTISERVQKLFEHYNPEDDQRHLAKMKLASIEEKIAEMDGLVLELRNQEGGLKKKLEEVKKYSLDLAIANAVAKTWQNMKTMVDEGDLKYTYQAEERKEKKRQALEPRSSGKNKKNKKS